MGNSFLLEFAKTGQVIIENGTAMFLNEYMFLLPVKTFLKLREVLMEKFGETEADEILKDLGKYQVVHALKRYEKVIGVQKIERSRFFDFGLKILNVLELGDMKFVQQTSDTFVYTSKNTPIALEYPLLYGKSKKPVDSFICGILEEAFTRILAKPYVCTEIKCLAKGDDSCIFELKPAK